MRSMKREIDPESSEGSPSIRTGNRHSSATSSSSSSFPPPETTIHRHGGDDESMDEIRKVFAKYDLNGDGRISSDELLSSLRALGHDASPERVALAMAEMDKDGDGSVDLNEFAEFLSGGSGGSKGSCSGGGASTELVEAFKVYDKDGNGAISASELHAVMRQLGERFSLRECERMIRTVDLDGDGSVSFDEFVVMMSKPLTSRRP